jgi:hypothetical protein
MLVSEKAVLCFTKIESQFYQKMIEDHSLRCCLFLKIEACKWSLFLVSKIEEEAEYWTNGVCVNGVSKSNKKEGPLFTAQKSLVT